MAPASEPRAAFDVPLLDALLDERGLAALVVSSPHNLRYLLGGYRFFLYASADSIGLSRYLPLLVYRPGAPADATYVGAGNEAWATDVRPLWVGNVEHVAWSARAAAQAAAQRLRAFGLRDAAIGIEAPYLPVEAMDALAATLPAAAWVDASELLEQLRAVKAPAELEIIRDASCSVVDAMLATFAASRPGDTKAQIVERLRREQTARGLAFDYCLVAAGADLNRAPSDQQLHEGEPLSLDSGANRRGYVADLARMGVAGEPSPRLCELLEQVELVQQAVRAAVRPGRPGGELFAVAQQALESCPARADMRFLAHGCGLTTHEAPRLTATGSPPYAAAHAEQPLRPGMVVSLETHVAEPHVGFVKLEDTVAVTEQGVEAFADAGRGWNRVGG